MLVGRIFRTLGMGLIRRDCSVRCITALYRPPGTGHFFALPPQCQIAQKCDGVGLHESTSQATQKESWPRKLEQGDKWSFCLVATTIVNKRRTLFHAETQSLSKRDSYAGLEQTGTLKFSTLSAFQNAMCRRSAASLLRGGAAS
jgi:hypothetical protein